jgi:hypothetical protein
MISHKRKIWKVSVATKEELDEWIKIYHIIANFSVPIQLLIIRMLTHLYPELWPLTKRNINYLRDVYNWMKECHCVHCKYITYPYSYN